MGHRIQGWRRVAGGLLTVFLLSGCKPRALTGEPVDLLQHMGGGSKRPAPDLKPAPPAVGPEAPYVPLVDPPRVQRVWIPAYVNDAGDLVAGHWIYLMLRSSRWFLDDGHDTEKRQLDLSVPAAITLERLTSRPGTATGTAGVVEDE